jgi:hypothetical protein
MKVKHQKGNWNYISPVYNLIIAKDFKQELRIGRVLFVDRQKLPRIRKRLGFPIVFSKIKEESFEFFNEAQTFAILPFSGIPFEEENNCRDIIEKAINIISFSQLGYCNRQNNSQFGTSKCHKVYQNYIIRKDKFDSVLNSSVESKILPYILNNYWRNFHKRLFFFDLLDLINNNSPGINSKWKKTLIRGAEMIGKSMQSRDIEYSFLWNMIVVEMLLTQSGDKYAKTLPERAESFIGWVGFWKEKNFEDRITEVYKKRCELVHGGNSENITVNDVLFSENLVFNIMWNIIKHLNIFTSKEKLILFSERIKAEKLLGIKSKIQPNTLMFMYGHQEENDLQRI